jgi:hypothetical protein
MHADLLKTKIEDGTFNVRPLPPGSKDEVGAVLYQLGEIDKARGSRPAGADVAFRASVAWRHVGEAESIVSAVRMQSQGYRCVFITSDGGASLVSENRGLPAKHIGHLLRELACHTSSLDPETLFKYYNFITNDMATPPEEAAPRGADFFQCRAMDGHCNDCDFRGAGDF